MPSDSKDATALISFKTPAAAKEIFRLENEGAIKKLATDMLEGGDASVEGKKKNNGAAYQHALSQLWEKADQSVYEDKAKKVDVFG